MSISNEAVEQIIRAKLPDAQVTVSGDGYKYEADIVSTAFEGMMTLKRHQLVYEALNEVITSGQLHALTLRTKTPTEAA